MEKRFNSILILVLLTYLSIGQNATNSVWYFGDSVGIDFNLGVNVLTNSSMYSNEGCATLCTPSGQLLMYTNGQTIWNKNHNVMVNGDNLNGSFSSTQSGIIIPQPGNNQLCYVFTADYEGNNKGLQYSVVDMNLQGGLGEVIIKNDTLVSPIAEKLTAISHSNDVDIWLIVHKWMSDKFYAYLITSSGINPPIISSVGDVHNGVGGNAVGQMKVSPRGNKIAITVRATSRIQILDFDRNTGVISNPISLTGITSYLYGLEYDQKGEYLYVSSYTGIVGGAKVYQYDISLPTVVDINNSLTIVGQTNCTHIGALQIAPNNKIYLGKRGQQYLGVINNPSALGTACNFVSDGLYLNGKNSRYGLPSYIQNEFDTDIDELENNIDICIYPNPTNGQLYIDVEDFEYLEILDNQGKILCFSKDNNIDLRGLLDKGVYLVKIKTQTGISIRKLILN